MTVPDDFNGGFRPPPPPMGQGQQYPGQQPYQGQQYGQQYGQQAVYATGPQNGLGVAALVLGIIALLLGILVVGGLFGALAVGLGFAGRSRAKSGLATNKGVATAGIVTGFLGILLAAAVVAALAVGGWEFWHSKTVRDIRQCISTNQSQQDACERKLGISPTPAP